MTISELESKKILILGFGREGRDTFLFLKKLFPEKVKKGEIAIADENKKQCFEIVSQNIKKYCGSGYLRRAGKWEVVVKSPGIPLSVVRPFLKKGVKITSQTEIFFNNFKGKIVGITGTKGKGTVSSLIYQMLKKAGKKVELAGNIGRPVLGVLLKKAEWGSGWLFVYELSSHQLQGLKKSPQIAVITNLFPDHLDYYKNIKEYYSAKQNIAKYQNRGELVIYNGNDKNAAKIVRLGKGRKIAVKQPAMAYQTRLKGRFNQLNIALAVRAVKELKASQEAIVSALAGFKGLPHRLECLGKFKGIEFYNDSMATLPQSTAAALKALPRTSVLLIGGSDKGSDYKQMAEAILESQVNTLIILGKGTGQKVLKEIKKIKKSQPLVFEVFETSSMKEAVKIAYQYAKKGEAVLLSPGAASFNLFKDYQERGDLFKKWVKDYAQKKRKANN